MTPKLPRNRILRGRGSFADILTRGTPLVTGSVKLFFAPGNPPTQLKIGFTALRGSRNAACRNRIKRCLREAFRLQQHLVSTLSGGIVFLYTGKTPRRSSEIDCIKIQQDVQAALKQLSRKAQQ